MTKSQRNRINACVFLVLVYQALREVMGLLLMVLSPSHEMGQLALSALVNLAALLGPCALARVLFPLRERELRVRPPRGEPFLFWLPLFLGGGALINLAAALLQPLEYQPEEIFPGGFGPVVMVLLIYCIIPAVGEELLFRGVLEGILTPCGKGIAIFLPALFFSLLHGRITQVFVAFFTGLFLGWLAWRSGSIFLGMGLHLVNNLLAVGESYLTQFGPEPLTLAFQCFHFIFWPVAAAALFFRAFRKGIFRRTPPAPGAPGPLSALKVPACALAAAAFLILRILENAGGMG